VSQMAQAHRDTGPLGRCPPSSPRTARNSLSFDLGASPVALHPRTGPGPRPRISRGLRGGPAQANAPQRWCGSAVASALPAQAVAATRRQHSAPARRDGRTSARVWHAAPAPSARHRRGPGSNYVSTTKHPPRNKQPPYAAHPATLPIAATNQSQLRRSCAQLRESRALYRDDRGDPYDSVQVLLTTSLIIRHSRDPAVAKSCFLA
jgi:hypothetical protein